MDDFLKKIFNKRRVYDILLIALLSFVLTLTSFLFIDQVVDFSIPFKLLKSPLILLMNFIPIFILMVLMYFVFASVGGAFLSVGAIIFIMGIANQNKLFYRDDNLRITDIVLVREAFGMLNTGLKVKFHKLYVVFPIFISGLGLLLLKVDKFRLGKKSRWIGIVVIWP